MVLLSQPGFFIARQLHLAAQYRCLCCLSQTCLAVVLLLPAGQIAALLLRLLSLLLCGLAQLLSVLLILFLMLVKLAAFSG